MGDGTARPSLTAALREPVKLLISYAEEDRDWAAWIDHQMEDLPCEVLNRSGDFLPGVNRRRASLRGLVEADVVLVVLSSAYLDSGWAADVARLKRQRVGAPRLRGVVVLVRVEDGVVPPGPLGRSRTPMVDLLSRSDSSAGAALVSVVSAAIDASPVTRSGSRQGPWWRTPRGRGKGLVAAAVMAGVAVIVTIIMPRLTAGGSQKSGCGVRLTEVGVIDTGGARVYDAVTAPDGRLLALRRNDGVVSLWNVAEPARAVEVGELYVAGAGVVGGMAFGRDGRTLAAVTGDVATVAWWDISDPAAPVVSSTMAGRITIVYTMALSADGRILAIGGLAGAVKAVEFWDVTDPSRPFRAGALEDAVQDGTVDSVAFSPVGRVLAVAGRLGDSAGLWDVTDPARPVRRSTLVGRPANLGDMVAVAFSSDGRTLATAGRFGDEVTLWDVTDPARPRRHGSVVGSTADIASLAFSFDGRLLASASNGSDEIVLMTIEKGVASRASSIDTGEQEADFAAFAAAGCLLVTANADPVVRLWTASR